METISNTDRIIMKSPKMILVVMVILGTLIMSVFLLVGIGTLVATGIFLCVCLRRIPARPPYVGVVVIWGKRLPIVIPEGWHVFASFFPFMYTVTMVNVEKTNVDITFPNIRCKARIKDQEEEQGTTPFAGGEISAKISYTYYPDYKGERSGQCLISFINSGGHEGVQKIIKDLIEEDLREMARDNSWEDITFSSEIKGRLVKKLTGEELTEEIAEELNKNGLPDIADLGVKISRFNVGEVKEQGELAIAAEKFAKEVQERRGENEEMEFVYEWVKKFKEIGASADVALDTIQVERGKAEKKIRAFRGFETTAEALGKGLSGILRKS